MKSLASSLIMASGGAKFSALSVVLLFLHSPCVSSYMNDCGVFLNKIDVNGANSPLILKYQGKSQSHRLQLFHPSYLDSECLVRNLYVGDGLADFSCLGHSLVFPGLERWPAGVRATSLIGSRQGSFDNFTVVTPEHPAAIDLGRMPGPISCTGAVEPTMRRLAEGKYQAGYQMNVLDFLPVFDLTVGDRLTFAHAQILAAIGRRPRIDESREALRRGPLYGDSPAAASRLGGKNQLSAKFRELFKRKLAADNDIDNYLVHGQLLSKDDLFYIPEQRATFFLENTALIWNSINDGNWKTVGDVVRRLASETVTDLDVYSGSLDCLTFDKIPMDMHNLKNSTKHTCVPKFLFKAVLDNRYDLQRGIVFITVNDPTVQIASNGSIPDDVKLCDRKAECDQLHPEFSSPKRGYTYCCNLNDFAYWNEIQNSSVGTEMPDVMMPYYNPFSREPPPPPPPTFYKPIIYNPDDKVPPTPSPPPMPPFPPRPIYVEV